MSVLFGGRSQRVATQFGSLVPNRRSGGIGKHVTDDDALKQSIVWAAVMLRANMISTLPLDTFRKVDGLQIEVPKPPVLRKPSPHVRNMREWMFSSQVDLDRTGNAVGIITERDGVGLPRAIELQAMKNVTVVSKDGEITYRISGKEYAAADIWHERQYTVPGLFVGLSPIAHAALSLGVYASANELAIEWFTKHGQRSGGHLKNTGKSLDGVDVDAIKDRYKIATEGGDLFVTGNDWELNFSESADNDLEFLKTQNVAALDICRFFGVPGDVIDIAQSGSSVTYANVTQRFLQLLVIYLQAPITRREDALSDLLAQPRFVKLNTDALLRMDPKGVTDNIAAQIKARILAPSEGRALINRPPLTPEQISEFASLFPKDFSTAGRN
jgi:HK97 family phage portal protein